MLPEANKNVNVNVYAISISEFILHAGNTIFVIPLCLANIIFRQGTNGYANTVVLQCIG